MIRYIPIQVHEDGVHCGMCRAEDAFFCGAFQVPLDLDKETDESMRCPACLAQAKEIAPDDELTALRAQVEALKETIHDELSANLRLRELGGARPDEDMTTFLERVFAERDKAGVHLVAWVEKDGSLVWHDSASAVGRNLYVKQ